jgi:hypothetical protein
LRKLLVLLAVLAGLAIGPRLAAAAPPPDLLTQVQGADVLGDLLTYIAGRADARVHVMRTFLAQIGKADAYDEANPLAQMPRQLSFEQVLGGAILFVQDGGDTYADPALKTMGESQLTQQLATLQNYDRDEFLHILQQREAAGSMRVYLQSIGQFGHYCDWARGKLPATNPVATEPAAATPEQEAGRISDLINWIQDMQWKKAQACGMSRADFEKKWQAQVQQYHDTIMSKLDGMQRLAVAFARSQAAENAAGPGPTQISPQPSAYSPSAPAGQAAPPPPVLSPYTSAHFANADDSLWNMWDDNYWDTGYRYRRRR